MAGMTWFAHCWKFETKEILTGNIASIIIAKFLEKFRREAMRRATSKCLKFLTHGMTRYRLGVTRVMVGHHAHCIVQNKRKKLKAKKMLDIFR